MKERIEEVTAALEAITAEARERFGNLSAEQLNWKPAAGSWSVGQCLDHLITTHALYFPLLQRLAEGSARPTLWERLSPCSGFFGRFLVRAVRPDNPKKVKTTARAEPSTSAIEGDIVERFTAHQAELIVALRNLPSEINPRRTIITSPLLALITYSLDDCLTIFVAHGQRHIDQARRVMEGEGFPA